MDPRKDASRSTFSSSSSSSATTQQQMENLLQNVNGDFQLILDYVTITVTQYFNHINMMLGLINVILRNVDQYYDLHADLASSSSAPFASPSKENSSKRQTRVKFAILEQREKMLHLVKKLIVTSVAEMKYEVVIEKDVLDNRLPLPTNYLAKLPPYQPTQPQFSVQQYLYEASFYIDELNTSALFQLHHDVSDLIKKIQHRQEQLFALTDSSGTVNLLHLETCEKRQFYVKMELYNEKIDFLRNLQLITMNLGSKKEKEGLIETFYQRLAAQEQEDKQQQNSQAKSTQEYSSPERGKAGGVAANESKRKVEERRIEKDHNPSQSVKQTPPPAPTHSDDSMEVETPSSNNRSIPTIFRVSTVAIGAEILYQLRKESSLELVPAVVLSADQATRECRIRLTESGKEKDTVFDRLYSMQQH